MDLGKWAFNNRGLIYFLVAVLMAGGVFSVYSMSKLEDPEVKVKMAMVVAVYPGASAHQVELEVTDVLEKQIRMMGDLDNVESYSYNDLCIMQVELRSTLSNNDVEQCWDRLRRKVTDAQSLLPSGVTVSVKDDFSNVYGIFYALTGDGLSERELSDYAELLKREAAAMEGVDRVELYGKQKEVIEIRLLQDKMSSMGVMPAEVLATLNGQNGTHYAGYYDNGDQRVRVTVNDKFRTVEDISRMLIQGHERDQLRVADIAEVEKLEMSESMIKVEETESGALKITNLCDWEIPCVRVFYKLYMADENTYIGGITYVAKLTGLEAQGSQTIMPSHYTGGYSLVVMVWTYDTTD